VKNVFMVKEKICYLKKTFYANSVVLQHKCFNMFIPFFYNFICNAFSLVILF